MHGIDAWYIGPSMEHYRCFKCRIPEIVGTINVDTVEFFPQQIPFPTITPDTYLWQTAADLLSNLTSKQSPIPDLTYGNKCTNAFIEIAQTLQRDLPPPSQKNIPINQTNLQPTAEPRVDPTRTDKPNNKITHDKNLQRHHQLHLHLLQQTNPTLQHFQG